MKKRVSLMLAVAMLLMLVACGNEGNDAVLTNKNGGETSVDDSVNSPIDGADNVSAEAGETAEANQGATDFTLLLPRESDELYFKPVTDDYVYISYGGTTDDGYGGYFEEATLLSFNEDGEVVQEISRNVDVYFVTAQDFSLTEYVGAEFEPFYTMAGDALYENVIDLVTMLDGKYTTYDTSDSLFLKEKAEVVMKANDQSVEAYYFSKPDANLLKTFENEANEDDIVITKIYPPVTDDYVVTWSEETDSDVVRSEQVTCYDESGNAVKYYHGTVFASEQAVLDTLDRLYKITDYIIRDGNTLVVTSSFDSDGKPIEVPEDAYQKFYIQESDLSHIFFSKPYLTDEQFAKYVEMRTR